MKKLLENITLLLAWRLPRTLVYWACIRVAAYASTGRYSTTEVTGLTIAEALRRWEDRDEKR